MPKQLFLSPAASGKTDATIQLARETAVSGHEIRICVPTDLQARLIPEADIEKEYLEDLIPRQQTILLDLEQYIRYHFLRQSWEI